MFFFRLMAKAVFFFLGKTAGKGGKMGRKGISLKRIYNKVMNMTEEEFFRFLDRYQEKLSEENIMMLIDSFLLIMQMKSLDIFSGDWLQKTCDWLDDQRDLVREGIIDDIE